MTFQVLCIINSFSTIINIYTHLALVVGSVDAWRHQRVGAFARVAARVVDVSTTAALAQRCEPGARRRRLVQVDAGAERALRRQQRAHVALDTRRPPRRLLQLVVSFVRAQQSTDDARRLVALWAHVSARTLSREQSARVIADGDRRLATARGARPVGQRGDERSVATIAQRARVAAPVEARSKLAPRTAD